MYVQSSLRHDLTTLPDLHQGCALSQRPRPPPSNPRYPYPALHESAVLSIRPFTKAIEASETKLKCRVVADLVIGWLQYQVAGEMAAAKSSKMARVEETARSESSTNAAGRPLQENNWGNLKEQCVLDPSAVHKLIHPVKASARRCF